MSAKNLVKVTIPEESRYVLDGWEFRRRVEAVRVILTPEQARLSRVIKALGLSGAEFNAVDWSVRAMMERTALWLMAKNQYDTDHRYPAHLIADYPVKWAEDVEEGDTVHTVELTDEGGAVVELLVNRDTALGTAD